MFLFSRLGVCPPLHAAPGKVPARKGKTLSSSGLCCCTHEHTSEHVQYPGATRLGTIMPVCCRRRHRHEPINEKSMTFVSYPCDVDVAPPPTASGTCHLRPLDFRHIVCASPPPTNSHSLDSLTFIVVIFHRFLRAPLRFAINE